MFWDGTRWVAERPATPTPIVRRRGRLVDWLATVPVLVLVPLLFSPFLSVRAADPALSVTGLPVAGGKLTIAGASWPTRTSLQLTWDGSVSAMPSARTSRTGTFSTTLTVPAAAAPAPHVIAILSSGKTGKGVGAQRTVGTGTVLASVTVTVIDPGGAPDPTAPPTVAPTRPPADPTAPPVDPTATPTRAPDPTPDPTPKPPDPTPKPDPTPDPTAPPDPGPELTFAAECGGSTLDSRFKAFYGPGDPGFALDVDFLSNLQQVDVANGFCTITAKRMSTPSGRPYGSGMFATFGNFNQVYGTWAARIRYPAGQGVWPAFFLLPRGQMGPFPEIDIFEAYPAPAGAGGGSGLNTIVQTLHYGPGLNHYTAVSIPNMTDQFHVHKLVWTPSKLAFYVDGNLTSVITAHVPDVRMYPVFDLALGAPGYRIDSTTPTPLKMDIDWVRVWAP